MFNNAYIFASKKERAETDWKPYYRQSAIAFLGVGVVFFLTALGVLFNRMWWMPIIAVGGMMGLAVYAVISSIRMEKNRKG